MNDTIRLFHDNIQRVNGLSGVYRALDANTTPALDLSDILRAELVMAVSTLDQFIHSLVEEGTIEIYRRQRPRTDAYANFQIPLSNLSGAVRDMKDTEWLRDCIRATNSTRSFQRADKIAEALKMISDKKLWDRVSKIMGKPQKDIKQQINRIIDRRNQISHTYDINPAYPEERWPIDIALVDKSVKFIDELGHAIFETISSRE